MTTLTDIAQLRELAPGSHVCWVVDEPETYLDVAAELLRDAAAHGEKPFLFGPEGSSPLVELAPLAAAAVDPGVAFLDGGVLDPPSMFAMFREQTALARAEGYRGVRVVADMDWLLPRAGTEAVVSFELLLDRQVRQLDATILCAYRTTSFRAETVAGSLSVHSLCAGDHMEPSFQLVAGDDQTWRLSGEVDFADERTFDAAISAIAGEGVCKIEVSGLTFIDVAGMRALAEAAQATAAPIRLVGASPLLRRAWELARFAEIAPSVELVS